MPVTDGQGRDTKLVLHLHHVGLWLRLRLCWALLWHDRVEVWDDPGP